MNRSSEAGDMVAAGVDGVQCAIALVDAVTCAFLGRVATGQSHDQAVDLLRRSGAHGAGEHAKQFARVIELKYAMAYDDRLPTDEEADLVVDRVRRLHRWAASVLPQHAAERE
ncbi:MAG TPA: hypothetical protein VGB42_01225 [Candidatus Thermoplasmatota archaeon]